MVPCLPTLERHNALGLESSSDRKTEIAYKGAARSAGIENPM